VSWTELAKYCSIVISGFSSIKSLGSITIIMVLDVLA
jgi:hypothetical protein